MQPALAPAPVAKSFDAAPGMLRLAMGVWLAYAIVAPLANMAWAFLGVSRGLGGFEATLVIVLSFASALFWLILYGALFYFVARGSNGARTAIVVIECVSIAFNVLFAPIAAYIYGTAGGVLRTAAPLSGTLTVASVLVSGLLIWALTRPDVVAYTRPGAAEPAAV